MNKHSMQRFLWQDKQSNVTIKSQKHVFVSVKYVGVT